VRAQCGTPNRFAPDLLPLLQEGFQSSGQPTVPDVRWHSHPDVVFVQVTEGALTLYAADDPNCTPHVVQAGQSFIEPINKVHIARNESPIDRASWYATHIGVPSGVPTTTDEAAPGNCPF
jgi:Cupin domain